VGGFERAGYVGSDVQDGAIGTTVILSTGIGGIVGAVKKLGKSIDFSRNTAQVVERTIENTPIPIRNAELIGADGKVIARQNPLTNAWEQSVPSLSKDGVSGSAVNPLRAGQLYEVEQLSALGVGKNNTVFRPKIAEVETATFKAMVGEPKYTPGGQLKGTIFDSVENGYLEIKGGTSELNSTYQLRLETYKATVDRQPFTVQTNRPVNPQFQKYLDFWGVKVIKP